MSRRVGYFLESSFDEASQTGHADALVRAGCEVLYRDRSDAQRRWGLQAALRELQAGDVLVVSELEHAGSAEEIVRLLAMLLQKLVGLQSSDGEVFLCSDEFETNLAATVTAIAEISPRPAHLHRPTGRPQALDEVGVMRAEELRSKGYTMAKIAEQLGVARSTLYRALDPSRRKATREEGRAARKRLHRVLRRGR